MIWTNSCEKLGRSFTASKIYNTWLKFLLSCKNLRQLTKFWCSDPSHRSDILYL